MTTPLSVPRPENEGQRGRDTSLETPALQDLLIEARDALAGLQPTPWIVKPCGDEGKKRWGVFSKGSGYWLADACGCIPDDDDGKRHMAFMAAAPTLIARLIGALESVTPSAGQRRNDLDERTCEVCLGRGFRAGGLDA